MTDREYLNMALASMHSGQWFGWKKEWTGEHRMSYENIIVHDSSITKPTEEEVNAKIQELKDVEQAVIDKKASGKQKLKDLGLDDDEIQALMGA
jgi:arsenate reductase-like glutaredoxin family protein